MPTEFETPVVGHNVMLCEVNWRRFVTLNKTESVDLKKLNASARSAIRHKCCKMFALPCSHRCLYLPLNITADRPPQFSAALLLARLIGLYRFAGWRLWSFVVVVVCDAAGMRAGRPAAGRVGGRAADIARRASTDTSR